MPAIPSYLDLYPDEPTSPRGVRTARAPRITPEQAAQRLRDLGASTTTTVPPQTAPALGPASPSRISGALSRGAGLLRAAGPAGVALAAASALPAVASERSLLKNPAAFLEDLRGAVPDTVSRPAQDLTRQLLGDDPLAGLRRFFGGSRTGGQADIAAPTGRGVAFPPNTGPQIDPTTLAQRLIEDRLRPLAQRAAEPTPSVGGPAGDAFLNEVRARGALGELEIPGGPSRTQRAITPDLQVPTGRGVVLNLSSGRAQVLGSPPAAAANEPSPQPALPPVPVIDSPYDKAGVNQAIQYVAARQQQATARRTAEQELLRGTQLATALIGAQGRTDAAQIGRLGRVEAAQVSSQARPVTKVIEGVAGTADRVVTVDPATGVGTTRNVVKAPPAGVSLADIQANADRAIAAGDALEQVNLILDSYGLPRRTKAKQ